MIHVEDLVSGMLAVMRVNRDDLESDTKLIGVALSGFSFSPVDLFQEIKNHIPTFQFSYDITANPNMTKFAQLWPNSLSHEEGRIALGFVATHSLSDTIAEIINAHIHRR